MQCSGKLELEEQFVTTKKSIPKQLPPVFERLNMSPDDWLAAVKARVIAMG
jgi:hypothetical protein